MMLGGKVFERRGVDSASRSASRCLCRRPSFFPGLFFRQSSPPPSRARCWRAAAPISQRFVLDPRMERPPRRRGWSRRRKECPSVPIWPIPTSKPPTVPYYAQDPRLMTRQDSELAARGGAFRLSYHQPDAPQPRPNAPRRFQRGRRYWPFGVGIPEGKPPASTQGAGHSSV
jgi:hypothetical protein